MILAERKDIVKLVKHLLLKTVVVVPLVFDIIVYGWFLSVPEWYYIVLGPVTLSVYIEAVLRICTIIIRNLAVVEAFVYWVPSIALGASWSDRRFVRPLAQATVFTLLLYYEPSLMIRYYLYWYAFVALIFLTYALAELLVGGIHWLRGMEYRILRLPGAINPDVFQGWGIPILRAVFNTIQGSAWYILLVFGGPIPPYMTVDIMPLLFACVTGSVLADAIGFLLKEKGLAEPVRRIAKAAALSTVSAAISAYESEMNYLFGHLSPDYTWVMFGILMFSLCIISEPFFSTRFAVRIVTRMTQATETKLARAVGWLVGSIMLSLLVSMVMVVLKIIAATLFGAPRPLSSIWADALEVGFVFFVVVFAINLLTVARTELTLDEPLQDMDYHANICTWQGRKQSQFVMDYFRSGYPSCVWFTRKNTMNAIERAFPWVLVFGGLLLSLGMVCLVLGSVYLTTSGQDIIQSLALLFAGYLLVLGGLDSVADGSVRLWTLHSEWRKFWIDYWSHVAERVELCGLHCLDESQEELSAYGEIHEWWGTSAQWRLLWTVYWSVVQGFPEQARLICLRDFLTGDGDSMRTLDWWDEERDLKPFWLSYESYLKVARERQKEVLPSQVEVLSWSNLGRSPWWGEKPNWSDKKYVRAIREEIGKRIGYLELDDRLPEKDAELRTYADKLAVFTGIHKMLGSHPHEDAGFIDAPREVKRVLNRAREVKSLEGLRLENLLTMYSWLRVARLAEQAPEALRELQGIEDLDEHRKREILAHAESRIGEISRDTGSLVPDFLKWTAIFYSIVFGIASWLVG